MPLKMRPGARARWRTKKGEIELKGLVVKATFQLFLDISRLINDASVSNVTK